MMESRCASPAAVQPLHAREETLESRGVPCLFLNTERGFGRKPPKKIGVSAASCGVKNAHRGVKNAQRDVFHGDLPLEVGIVDKARAAMSEARE